MSQLFPKKDTSDYSTGFTKPLPLPAWKSQLPGSGGGGGGKGGAGGGGGGRVSSVGGAGASRSRSEGGMPSVNSVGPTLARTSVPPMDSRPRALGSRWHRRWKASSFSLMSLRRVCTWLLVFSYVSYQADRSIGESEQKPLQSIPLGVRIPTQRTPREGHLSMLKTGHPGEDQQGWRWHGTRVSLLSWVLWVLSLLKSVLPA